MIFLAVKTVKSDWCVSIRLFATLWWQFFLSTLKEYTSGELNFKIFLNVCDFFQRNLGRAHTDLLFSNVQLQKLSFHQSLLCINT